mgnify:FL=1
MGNKEYLGDSVYADFDGYAFVLTTENGMGPSNTIVLEPQIMEALKEYVKRISRLLDPSVDRIE